MSNEQDILQSYSWIAGPFHPLVVSTQLQVDNYDWQEDSASPRPMHFRQRGLQNEGCGCLRQR